jgi:PKD repeat protein
VVIVCDSVYAVNGLNGTVKWRYGTGIPGISFNGSTPAIGDLNGDGILDVVASLQFGSNSQRLVALNGNNGSVIWDIAGSASFTGLGAPVPAIGDVDGDCDLDVVYNKAAIHGDNGTIMWGTPNSSFGATYCIIADLDDNCTVEVITGCGVYRADNGNTIWQLSSCSLNGWFAPAPRVGDFNPSVAGKEIVLAGAYNVNTPISMIEGITGNVLWNYSMAALNHTAEGVSIGDIDNDGCVEIVVAPDCCNGANTVLALDDNGNASNCGILASIGQVDFLPNDTSTCDCVTFRDFSSLCATSWSWQFPGGSPSTSSLQNPGTVCYSTPGTYPVIMIAHLNACAAADTAYHSVTVLACSGPVAQLSADNFICPGTCTDFTNLSVNATTYQWSFTGANPATSTDVNPVGICYNTPGTYDVTLIATDGTLSDTLNLPNYITVYAYPAPQGIAQSGDSLIANQGAVSYQWYFNGIIISGATNYFYVAPTGGDYNVVATDVNGCEVEAVIFDVIASVQFETGNGNWKIFPNPVSDKLIIQSRSQVTSERAVDVSVLNMLGEKIHIKIDDQLTVDCRSLPAGIYYVEINSSRAAQSNSPFRARFIKSASR